MKNMSISIDQDGHLSWTPDPRNVFLIAFYYLIITFKISATGTLLVFESRRGNEEEVVMSPTFSRTIDCNCCARAAADTK